MAEKVILHVGAPKTGTSFVQDLLFRERDRLAAAGVLYPAEQFDSHFRAALDLMQLPWGGLEWQANGTWDRLVAEVRAWPGTAVISHEILATASRTHVARALASLGDAEVHLLYSARDLVRQIPAEWQENVKHRRTTTYAEFLTQLRDPTRSEEVAQWFWGVQEAPDVLDRWGDTLPRQHVHLLTVPPPGAPRDLLWRRFASVIGIDPVEFSDTDPAGGRSNTSLGAAEASVVRRLNEAIEDVVWNHNYRPLVREYLVHQTLSRRPDARRITVPADVWSWAHGLSRSWVSELALRGYDVVGSLDDLVPTEPPLPFVDPDHADPRAEGDAAVEALSAMTKEAARLADELRERDRRVADLEERLDAAHSTSIYKAKERLVARAETSSAARVGLAAYRRLRRR